MATSQLLQLPVELRLTILQQLLFRSEPLTSRPVPCLQCADTVPMVAVYTHLFEHKAQKKTLDLHTEIIRTCRQLYNEGTPILYANTAAVKVWLEDDSMAPWLRHERDKFQRLSIGLAQYGLCDQVESLEGLPTRLPNVYFIVKLDLKDSEESHQPFYDNIATLLSLTRHLNRLVIHFELRPNIRDAPLLHQPSRYELIQDGLRPVCGIPYVQVTGNVPQAFAAHLAQSMMDRDRLVTEATREME